MSLRSIWQVSYNTPKSPMRVSYKALFTYLNTGMYLNHKVKGGLISQMFLWRTLYTLTTKALGWGNQRSHSRYPFPQFNTKKLFKAVEPKSYTPKPIYYGEERALWTFFNQSWHILRPKGTVTYKTHREFRIMFMHDSGSRPLTGIISASRVFARWTDAYNLFFNLAYSDAEVQLFSNKLFLEEALVFNWNQSLFDYKLFKYTQPFFAFKDGTHGEHIHLSVFVTLLQKLDLAIVVDLKNHNKFLRYLKRYNLYSIGLVPSNQSPWAVSYPVPAFSDSYVAQYYFLRWIFFIRGKADVAKYESRLAAVTLNQVLTSQ